MDTPTPEERADALMEVIHGAVCVGMHDTAQASLKETIVSMIDVAVKDERQACAQVAVDETSFTGLEHTGNKIAAAIRARS